jgi:hypothetical protein
MRIEIAYDEMFAFSGKSIFRFMAMIDNNSLHLGQSTDIFRSSGQMTFSAHPMKCPGKSGEFHFSAPRYHIDRYPAVFCFKTPNKSKSAIVMSGESGGCGTILHFKWVVSSDTLLAPWHRELSKCNRKFMRARSVDFVESSWINGFDV